MKKGNKPTYEEFIKTVNPDFADTTYYNLREAYNELPWVTLKGWRDNPNQNHLPDTYKLPGHPTFSVESKYYKPGMKAGYWEGEKYVPIKKGENAPVFVSDPNDPRYRVYRDSLMLHNASNDLINKFYTDRPGIKRKPFVKHSAGVGSKNFSDVPEESDAWQAIAELGYASGINPTQEIDDETYIPAYKKPAQPVKLRRRQIDIDPAPLAQTTLIGKSVLPKPNITPTAPQPQTGVLKQDFKGVPGVQVWSKRDKAGNLKPVALVNSAGESIDYNQYANGKFPEGFQYPKQYEKGGHVMKKKKGPQKMAMGGIPEGMDPAKYLTLPKAERDAYVMSLPEAERSPFVDSVYNYTVNQSKELGITLPPKDQPPVSSVNLLPTAPIAPPVAAIPARRPVLPTTQPLPAAGRPRKDILSDLKDIQPNPIDDTPNKALSDEYNKGIIDKGIDSLSSLATVTSSFVDMANMSNPAQTEIAPSAIAGGVSGLVSGGPLGAVIGAVGGALKAGEQRTAYEEAEAKKRRNILTGLRVAPSIQETGGVIEEDVDPDIDIPVQEEEGELMLLPDGRLVDSMADETHKEMKSKEVTDWLPSDTMVFSNSKKRLINLAKIKDDVFTITKGHYSEDGNEPGETILMGDVYGKKGKKTPAAMAAKVRKDLPVIEKPVEQIEINTNKENLRRRAELLLPIMQVQEKTYKKFEFEKPVKYEKGGVVKKLEMGATPVDACPPGFFKPTPESPCLPLDDTYAGMSTANKENWGPFREQVVGRVNDNASPVPPIGTFVPYRVDAGSSYKNLAKADKAIKAIEPGSFVRDPPATLSPLSSLSNSVLNGADPILGAQGQQIESDYAASTQEAQNLYRSHRMRNIGMLAARLAGDSFQDPTEDPIIQEAGAVNEMFPKITESQIREQTGEVRNSQNRVLSVINDSGISGSRLGSAIASTQARLIEGENQVRSHALDVNQSQQAKRYERLNSILNINRAAETTADNATRDNRNQLVSNISDVAASNIRDQGGLKESLSNRLEELKKWRQENKATVSQSEYNNMVRLEERKYKREYDQKMLDVVSKWIVNQ